jgi:hypothetical protein
MIEKYAQFFTAWCADYYSLEVWLTGIIASFEARQKSEQPLSEEQIKDAAQTYFIKGKVWLDALEVPATKRQVATLEAFLKKRPLKPTALLNEFRQLMKRFEEESVELRFLYVARGAQYAEPLATWGTIPKTFDRTRRDIICAVRTHAINLADASVFHSMRVLEIGLRELTTRLRINMNRTLDPSWHRILQDIEDKIDDLRNAPYRTAKPTAPQKARRRKKVEYYSNLARQFRYFKDVWRNHVMHGTATYDSDSAAAVIRNVRAFMTELEMRPPR